MGSGGIFGKGFLNGTQTRFDFVPEQSTDFIFCTLAEEWGFTGGIIVLALFVVLLFKIVQIAETGKTMKVFGNVSNLPCLFYCFFFVFNF